MKPSLSAAALVAIAACGSELNANSGLYAQLVGDWSCVIDHSDGDSIMTSTVDSTFLPSEKRTTLGSMQMTQQDGTFSMKLNMMTTVAFNEGMLVEQVIEADVEITEASGVLANIPNAKLALKAGMEAQMRASPPEVSEILELSDTRFVTKSQKQGIISTCERKG